MLFCRGANRDQEFLAPKPCAPHASPPSASGLPAGHSAPQSPPQGAGVGEGRFPPFQALHLLTGLFYGTDGRGMKCVHRVPLPDAGLLN